MTSQLLVTPSSVKNLVDPNGLASRNLQLWLAGVTNNTNQNTTNIAALQANIVFPPGGIILWPNATPVPTGRVDQGGTIVIGANTYKPISHV